MDKVKRAMTVADVPELGFVFPKARPLLIHLKDVVDYEVEEKYFVADSKLSTLVRRDVTEGVVDDIVRVGTLMAISGHDYLKRVYGLNGIAPTIPTGTGGNNMPKVEVVD